jgi:hypothetical protein
MGEILTRDFEPIAYRVDRAAVDGGVTVLAAFGGEGKSILAAAWAIGVQSGSTIAGLACTPGRSLIIDGENGERLIARRYRALAGPPEGVAIYEADHLDIAKHGDWLEQVTRHERANLVVLDSLRSLAPRLEENNGDTVAPVMRVLRLLARTTDAAVVVTHHRPKHGPGYRGSSVIRDQADVLLVMGRDEKDPEHRTRRYLHADPTKDGKFRIDVEPPWRWFHIHQTGEYLTLDAAEPPGGDREPTAKERAQLRIVSLLDEHPEGLTRSTIGTLLGNSRTNGTDTRALTDLEADGTLHRDGNLWRCSNRMEHGTETGTSDLFHVPSPLKGLELEHGTPDGT